MANPYESPNYDETNGKAAQRLRYASSALVIVCLLSIVMSALSVTGSVRFARSLEFPQETRDSLAMYGKLAALHGLYSIVVLFGAVATFLFRWRRLCICTSAMAVVPSLGPCFVLAIPFAI